MARLVFDTNKEDVIHYEGTLSMADCLQLLDAFSSVTQQIVEHLNNQVYLFGVIVASNTLKRVEEGTLTPTTLEELLQESLDMANNPKDRGE